MDMNISMDIHLKSGDVDMKMDMIFHIHRTVIMSDFVNLHNYTVFC